MRKLLSLLNDRHSLVLRGMLEYLPVQLMSCLPVMNGPVVVVFFNDQFDSLSICLLEPDKMLHCIPS